MILLIEMQCKDWEHSRVNSGLITQIHAAFPNEALMLCAEEKHIDQLDLLLRADGIDFDQEEIDFKDWRSGNQECKDDYASLLEQVIESHANADNIILLSCNKGIVLACSEISKKHSDKDFFIVMHAALEEVRNYTNPSLRSELWRFLSCIKQKRRPEKPAITMKTCMEKCESSNCMFIVYSPNYKEGLKDNINHDIIEKISFLHHPFFDLDRKESKNNIEHEKIIIGAYGQAFNHNAIRIINEYNKKYGTENVEFRVHAKEDEEILKWSNVVKLFKEKHVSNELLDQAIKGFDFILIPYDSGQYTVTASGIFCDAISREVPLLMLNSPYFEYYSRYNIGYMECSIKKMVDCISMLDTRSAGKFRRGAHILKNKAFDENVNKLRGLVRI